MIGTLDPSDKRVTIVGAGISGLLIGYALKKKGYQVVIHEKSNRCGGLIQTKNISYGMVETAAHSLLVSEPVQQFLDEIGVEMVPLNPDSRARFIYRNGRMRRMPLSIREIIGTLFRFFSKPKLLHAPSELSLEEWGHAYLGKPATQYLLAPFTTGVFACAPRDLHAQLSFPKLIPTSPEQSLFSHFRSQKKRNKTSSKRPKMMAFKYGTEDLIRKLESHLATEIRFNSMISDPSILEGNVILSVPSSDLAYSPLITATVFVPQSAFPKHPPQGVGVLIPRGEGLRMLGCLFNSSSFPDRVTDHHEVSLTVMYGGTSDPKVLSIPDQKLQEIIEQEIKTLFCIRQVPTKIEITRWERAIPIYSFKLSEYHRQLVQTFCSKPGRIVFSNFSGQVSIRGMIEIIQEL